ncbi:MAG: hypothetical protein WD489_01695, partial [Rhodovibrionaceae bacterium]
MRTKTDVKLDARKRWALPDRVFFACGACHILAYAFQERYGAEGRKAIWIKPREGLTGNHIFVASADWAFDYHGYCERQRFLDHYTRRACHYQPGWVAQLEELPFEVLISEAKSLTYQGLWLREPEQFLENALPRARRYLERVKP